MPDEKKYTERDLVLARREGYAHSIHPRTLYTKGEAMQMAAEVYPLPKRTQPRVENDPTSMFGTRQWRCVDGVLQTRKLDGINKHWYDSSNVHEFLHLDFPSPTAARVALWADLLANPTEEVGDE